MNTNRFVPRRGGYNNTSRRDSRPSSSHHERNTNPPRFLKFQFTGWMEATKKKDWDTVRLMFRSREFGTFLTDSGSNTGFIVRFFETVLDELLQEPVIAYDCLESIWTQSDKLTILALTSSLPVKEFLCKLCVATLQRTMSQLKEKPLTLIQYLERDPSPSETMRNSITLCRQIVQEHNRSSQISSISSTQYTKLDLTKFPPIPTIFDLKNSNLTPQLRKNKFNTPFSCIEEYVDTQYLLFREEFFCSFREGVQALLQTPSNVELHPKQLAIFHNAFIEGYYNVEAKCGLVFHFNGSTSAKKRLESFFLPGSLVMIHPVEQEFDTYKQAQAFLKQGIQNDRLQNWIYGIVLARENMPNKTATLADYGLQFSIKGQQICIEPYSELDFEKIVKNYGKHFIMLESPYYFRAYEAPIQFLQKLSPSTIPFQEILTGRNMTLEPPRYISQNPEMNISCLLKNRVKNDINVLQEWIPQNQTFLDPKQNESVQHIFRSKVSLVKGPPGTGKTFVGVHTIKCLLENYTAYHSPILIVCYTNHALDQILEHVYKFEENIVRIGSRSKSELIASRNLSELYRGEYKKPYFNSGETEALNATFFKTSCNSEP